ncbi:hypothetical protein D3C72_991940 [compost metagenome]
MHAVVQHADTGEHRTGHEAVRDHLHHRALQAQTGRIQALRIAHQPQGDEGTQGDKAHVRDRRIGDQLLHVVLDQRDQADVDHRDQRQGDDQPRPFLRGVRDDRQVEAQEAVATDLQCDRGQDHRTGGGCLDVGVRQPGVHREHRHLHREGDQEGEEDPGLFLARQLQCVQVGQLEAAALHVQVDQRHQHQHRAEEGVQEELQRGVDAARAAPDTDDQEHRDQHRLEEHVEQHRVGGGEDTDGDAFQDQEGGHVLVDALVDRAPGADQRQHRHQRGEQDQRDRNAVHAQVVADVVGGDPGAGLDELQRVVPHVVAAEQRQAGHEGQHRYAQRRPAGGSGVTDGKDQGTAEDRQPDENTE